MSTCGKPEGHTIRIHFFYVTLLLAGLLILVVTYQWTKLPGFTDYLGAAATITSLVLAVLAIIFSFVSNDSLSNVLGRLIRSSEDVERASDQIGAVAKTAQELTTKGEERDQRLLGVVGDLSSQIVTLGETARNLNTATTRIEDTLRQNTEQIDRLQSTLEKGANAAQSGIANTSHPEGTLNSASDFIQISSVSGLYVLIGAKLADEHKKRLDIAWISELCQNFHLQYLWGYLVAANSAGLLKAMSDGPIFTVTSVDPTIAKAEEKFRERMKDKAYESVRPDVMNALERMIAAFRDPKGQPWKNPPAGDDSQAQADGPTKV